MKRTDLLLKYADTAGKGLEIAPYFNPTLKKSDGYDIKILDVFDTDTLRDRALADSQIAEGHEQYIEPVDFVGDACQLGQVIADAGMAGQFAFVLSSHNFEHLPNPIKFLRGVGEALMPGGVLSMAIPDYRCCFDHFRLPTRLSDWLVAYHQDHTRHSAATIFERNLNFATLAEKEGAPFTASFADGRAPAAHAGGDIRENYQAFRRNLDDSGDYVDTHFSVVFPELFELYMRDLRHLGLIDLEIIEVQPTVGIEFFAHLKKCDAASSLSDAEFRQKRQQLLISVNRQLGSAAYGVVSAPAALRLKKRFERTAKTLLGRDTVAAIQSWNLRRLERRRARKRSTGADQP